MQIYWENITKAEKDNIDRGLYMILPLRYRGSFQSVSIAETEEEISKLVFDSSDFTELLSVKCRKENFVKRFSMNSKVQAVREKYPENGIRKSEKHFGLTIYNFLFFIMELPF